MYLLSLNMVARRITNTFASVTHFSLKKILQIQYVASCKCFLSCCLETEEATSSEANLSVHAFMYVASQIYGLLMGYVWVSMALSVWAQTRRSHNLTLCKIIAIQIRSKCKITQQVCLLASLYFHMVSTNTSQRSDLSVCYFFFIFFSR